MIQRSGALLLAWGRKKFPPFREMIGLFATIVFLIYGWTCMAFFWKLSSWLFMLKLSEIAVILAYILASDLLESLLLLVAFLFACLVLPSHWLRDDLTVRGSIILYAFTFWACIFALNSLIDRPSQSEALLMAAGLPASIALLVFLVRRFSGLRRLVQEVSDRLSIFVYVWIPLSVLSLVVVIMRWVGGILGVV